MTTFLKSKTDTPLKVALIAGGAYLLFTLLMLARAGSIQPSLQEWPNQFFLFIHPGSKWDTTHTRPFNTENIGYDGQFYYDLARSPLQPATQIDKPAYRTARILYPLLAWAFAFAQPSLIPFTLLLVNWLALIGTVYLLGSVLLGMGRAPGLALLYALWPGTFCAVFYDVSEPVCFFFVAAAVWLHSRRPQAVWGIGFLFLLGSLTKELALLFAAGWFLYYLTNRQWPALVKLSLAWGVPFGLWQLFLLRQFGKDGLSAGQPFVPIPLGGYFEAVSYHPPVIERVAVFLATIVPLCWVCLALYRTWRLNQPELQLAAKSPLLYAWPIHLAFLLFLPTATFIYLVDHARNLTGLVILVVLLPLPEFRRLRLYLIVVSCLLTLLVAGFMAANGNAFLYSFGI